MATAVSTQLSALTGSNTIQQMMSDVNSLKTLSALATDAAGSGDFVPTTGGNFTGNVGIGTASPADELDVSGNMRLTGTSTETRRLDIGVGRTGDGYAHIDLVGDATYTDYGARFIRNNGGLNTTTDIRHRGTDGLRFIAEDAGTVQFSTNDIERMRIDSSGNIGIAVTDPSQKLEVLGNAMLKATSTESRFLEIGTSRTGDGNSYLDFIGDTTYSDYGLRILRFGGANSPTQIKHRGTSTLSLVAEDAGKVTFSTNDTERMRVDSSGNVGIGTSSPSEPLEVAGKIKTTSGGVEFPDGTTQTSAATAGISTGKAIAMAIVFG